MSRNENRSHHHHHHHHQHHHRPSLNDENIFDQDSQPGYETLNLTIRRHRPNALDPIAHHLTSNHSKNPHFHHQKPAPLIQEDLQVFVKPSESTDDFQEFDKPVSRSSRVHFHPNPTVIEEAPIPAARNRQTTFVTTTPSVQIYVSQSPPENQAHRTPTPEPVVTNSPPVVTNPPPLDPDERPIRPMKNVQAYQPTEIEAAPASVEPPPSSTQRKIVRPPKLITPRKTNQNKTPPPPVSPIRIEPVSNRTVPSRNQSNIVGPRRPIRLDIIPKKVPPLVIPQTKQNAKKSTRVIVEEEYIEKKPQVIVEEEYIEKKPKVIVEEYIEEDEPDIIIEEEPEIVEYRIVPSRRRELRPLPRGARIVRVADAPIKRVIYRS